MSAPSEPSLASRPASVDLTSERATDVTTSVDPLRPRRRGGWLLAAVSLFALALLAHGLWHRRGAEKAAAEFTTANLVPTVAVQRAAFARQGPDLSLPASIDPLQKTEIRARAGGYVKRWRADLGQHVAAGEVLADIETPDLDQDVRKAEADVAQARANLALARANAERYRTLIKDDAVSRQEYDTREAQLQVSEAALASSEAALRRQRDLMQFQAVVAPFAGVVTARRIEVGDLVTTGATSAGLFTLEQVDTLRVLIDVPQTFAGAVKPGMMADLRVAEYPGRTFTGKVVRTAGALNAATRTMRVELNVPNPDEMLTAGAFVKVHLALPPNERALLVPVTAVRILASGPQVLVVDAGNRIARMPVKLGRDLGTQFEVVEGLQPGARVVRNPTDLLRAGLAVHVVDGPKP